MYELLGQLTLICAGSCLILSVKPNSFFAEFLLSCGLVFKGTWLFQAGLSLNTDVFGLQGCEKMKLSPSSANADVKCVLDQDGFRAVALMNFLFVIHATVVFIMGFGLFGLMSSYKSLRCGEERGALLAELDSESVVRPSHELELE